jgi:tetratricopeptide (TPR) repeat protein
VRLRLSILILWVVVGFVALSLTGWRVALAQTAPEIATARAQIEAGNYPSAILRLEAYIKQRPQDPEARFLLARAYYLQGGITNLERAEESIRGAIRITGSRPEFEWLYGLILVGQGKASAGLARLKVAASADPKGPNARDVYRYAMDWGLVSWREGDVRQALEAFGRAARAAPDQPWPLVHQGAILLSVREPDQALIALNRAVVTLERSSLGAKHPAAASAYYWRGRVYEALGKFTEARADYLTSLDRDPNFVPSREALTNVSAR